VNCNNGCGHNRQMNENSWALIMYFNPLRSLLLPCIIICGFIIPAKAEDLEMMNCFVYSYQSGLRLAELQNEINKKNNSKDVQDLINEIGGRNLIEQAVFDTDTIAESFLTMLSKKESIKSGQALFNSPSFKFSAALYDADNSGKGLKERFLKTFAVMQACVNKFILKI
ncbi:MAG: hypothetical protein ACKOPC_10850, partial [Methylocystis sp.]